MLAAVQSTVDSRDLRLYVYPTTTKFSKFSKRVHATYCTSSSKYLNFYKSTPVWKFLVFHEADEHAQFYVLYVWARAK